MSDVFDGLCVSLVVKKKVYFNSQQLLQKKIVDVIYKYYVTIEITKRNTHKETRKRQKKTNEWRI